MDLSKTNVERALRGSWNALRERVESGTTAVRDVVGGLPYLASVATVAQNDQTPRDETHYFLVPTPFVPEGWALYTVHRLPEGVSRDNELDKLRVFHLPTEDAAETLIELTLAEGSAGDDRTEAQVACEGASVGERLHEVANKVDRQELLVTGGILLIGGAVAVANPMLGAAIVAKSLIPSLGINLTSGGLRMAGDKLKTMARRSEDRARARAEAKALADARKVFDKIPVRRYVNPILQDLERALRTDETEFDPSVEVDFEAVEIEGWNRDELVQMTARAIVETYGAADGAAVAEGLSFGPEDRRWLTKLRALASTEKS